MLLNYKYKYEKDFEEDVVFVEYDSDKGHWIFENDFWEGQEEVYIMGYMNHHYDWDFRDILKIMKLSTENDVLKTIIKNELNTNNQLRESNSNLKSQNRILKKDNTKYLNKMSDLIDENDELKGKCRECRIMKDIGEIDKHNQMLLAYIQKTQGIKDIHKWYIQLTRKE